MKQFTVKDFIAHNNPCFSCGSNIILKIGTASVSYTNAATNLVVLRPTVLQDRTEMNLKVTYTDTLQLWIFHKSNKILTSNTQALTEYLFNHRLFLSSQCDKCFTNVSSQYLEFNMSKGFVKPVELESENIAVIDGLNRYHIHSDFNTEKSEVLITRTDNTSTNPIKINLPLLPLSRFKNREQLLTKLKVYALFS